MLARINQNKVWIEKQNYYSSEFKQINYLPFPLKSSENHRLSDISREIEVNYITCIYLTAETKFVDDP